MLAVAIRLCQLQREGAALGKIALATGDGHELLEGANCSVFGWSSADERHRVYLDLRTGLPRREVQEKGLRGYPTTAEVRFLSFEALYGSDILFNHSQLLEPPDACAFALPAWSGKGTPYDADDYICPDGSGLSVVRAVKTGPWGEPTYTWPTLRAPPPAAYVKKVPHEGGPGDELTCH